jgi:hypothetical protein
MSSSPAAIRFALFEAGKQVYDARPHDEHFPEDQFGVE